MTRSLIYALAFALLLVAAPARADERPRLEMVDPDGGRQPLPMVGSELQVTVRGAIAQVRHLQRFYNPATTPIEAVYVFPLHQRAAIGAMVMHLGPRTITAKIKRRDEARATYEAARAAGKTTALLEQERPNIFTQSVSGILAGETIEIELTYDILLAPDDDWYELALPTVVGPRYIPGAPIAAPAGTGTAPPTDRVPDADRISPSYQAPGAPPRTTFGFALDLDAGFPITHVDSPSHKLIARDLGPSHVTIALAAPDEVASKDVVVRWQVMVKAPAVHVMAGRATGDGYLAAIIQPPPIATTQARPPRELMFVLDTSGSMTGEPLALVKQAIRYALDRLEPGDTFRIINFSSDVGGFAGGASVAASTSAVRQARSWLNGLGTGGGTEMLSGIRAALADPPTDGRNRYVCFMTDGYIGNEAEILAEIAKARQPSTYLFSFGVGSSVNRYLIDEMAVAGHGAAQVLLLDDAPAPQIAHFFAQLGAPMWSKVKVEFDGVVVADQTPLELGDLFPGQPLVVAGHYQRGGAATVRVSGVVDGQPVVLEQEITLPDVGGDAVLLGRLWARAQIRELSRPGQLADRGDETREEITAIALAHALASAYTSFVAVDERPRVKGAMPTVGVPVEVPEGVEAGEVITIVSAAPVIDQGITTTGMSISTEYIQNIPVPGRTFDSTLGAAAGSQGDGAFGQGGSGRASGELGVLGQLELDGRTQGGLHAQLGLALTERAQLGFDATLSQWRGEATHLGFLATFTRWALWRRLALRLALGLDASFDTDAALAWRAELLHPLATWDRVQPLVIVGVSDVDGDDHAPAPTLGLGLRF